MQIERFVPLCGVKTIGILKVSGILAAIFDFAGNLGVPVYFKDD